MDRQPDQVASRRRRKAAWALLLLAPISGELTFSGVGWPVMWLAFPLLVPMYGAGVLLVRELVVRSGGGWPSLLVMGLVYELAEDGFGLQALTSTTMYNADEWGSRVLGVNITYWEAQAGYHIVFSVLIPIMLVDLLFPDLRRKPYLRRPGLAWVAIVAVVGIVLARASFAASEDPGYQAPAVFLIGSAAAMLICSVVALRVLPRCFPATAADTSRRAAGRVPPVGVVGSAGGLATIVFLGLLFPRGNPPRGPALGDGVMVPVAMALAAGVALATVVVVRRWSRSIDWTDHHRIWLAGGALVGHTLFMVVASLLNPAGTLATVLALITGPLVIIGTVLALARSAGRAERRPNALPGAAGHPVS